MNTPVKLSTFEKFKQSGYLDDVPVDIATKLVDVICNQIGYRINDTFLFDEYQMAMTKAIMSKFPTELVEVFKTPAALTKKYNARVVYTMRYSFSLTKEEILKKDPVLIEKKADACVSDLFEILLIHDYETMYVYTLFSLQPIDAEEDCYMLLYRAVFE